MNQNQQHRVQPTKLYYNAAEKYKHPIPAVTGARLKYEIKELRVRPEKLTESYQEQEQAKETATLQESRHDWEEWGNTRKR